jgi:hypothetical protein
VFAITTGGAGRIITSGGVVTNLAANTEEGFMTRDGTAAIYRTTAGAIVKHVAAPTTLVATGAQGLLGDSADGKRILYFTQVDPQNDTIDALSVDHTVASPTPVTYVATPISGPLGFNATSGDFVYLEIGASSIALKSKPAAGGAEKVLADDAVSAELTGTGTGAIVYTNPDPAALQQGVIVADIGYVDTAAGGAAQPIATQIPEPLVRLKDKTLVYGKIGTGAGIFRATLP